MILTIDDHRDLERLLAPRPDLAAKVLTAEGKPRHTFPSEIGAVDLAKPHALLILTGLGIDGAIGPITDPEGFVFSLKKTTLLAMPSELRMVVAAHETQRLEPRRGMIGRDHATMSEAEWRRALTPWVVIENVDDFLDVRKVMRAVGLSEKNEHHRFNPSLVIFVESIALSDPALVAAWALNEHILSSERNASPWRDASSPASALESACVTAARRAANARGDSYGPYLETATKVLEARNAAKPAPIVTTEGAIEGAPNVHAGDAAKVPVPRQKLTSVQRAEIERITDINEKVTP